MTKEQEDFVIEMACNSYLSTFKEEVDFWKGRRDSFVSNGASNCPGGLEAVQELARCTNLLKDAESRVSRVRGTKPQ